MLVQNIIRGVFEEVRDVLAARLVCQSQSKREYLRCELEQLASLPYRETLLQGDCSRKETAGTCVQPPSILCSDEAGRACR